MRIMQDFLYILLWLLVILIPFPIIKILVDRFLD
ncbi:hypothetical protein LCGC14_0972830 [marine sediment metagenome]|uniref:Uncharacterized protein n=1 Tax=marine sediment metagenome TaxID=412755 RepID=A0A0F9QUB7_9ZZZZ